MTCVCDYCLKLEVWDWRVKVSTVCCRMMIVMMIVIQGMCRLVDDVLPPRVNRRGSTTEKLFVVGSRHQKCVCTEKTALNKSWCQSESIDRMAIVKANVLIWTLHNDATIIIDQQWLVSVLVVWMGDWIKWSNRFIACGDRRNYIGHQLTWLRKARIVNSGRIK